MSFQANCPTCGTALTFTVGTSLVVVCPSCRSVVARTDRTVESLGQIADLTATATPLALGLTGAVDGRAFRLTGRTQLGHALGGRWDEWYAAFDDGRWGWLAEAQGRFVLTFEMDSRPKSLPPFDELTLGAVAPQLGAPLIVAEKGQATYLAAEGEIPFRFAPGETYAYADLSGAERRFGTLDYGDEPPRFYAGHERTLTELGLDRAASHAAERRVETMQVACPNCGGGLELRAPDETERVVCPFCGSLLDADHGALRYLTTLRQPKAKLLVPLGASGTLDGVLWTALGQMRRSVEIDGTRYGWDETLLHAPGAGFSWLVYSDGHITLARTIPPGEVSLRGRDAGRNGQPFKRFQDATARVDAVYGEFYWRVEVGQTVETTDFVAPPLGLSQEIYRYAAPAFSGEMKSANPLPRKRKAKASLGDGLGEVQWSLSRYVPHDEVERAFGLPHLPRPAVVAPTQPNPVRNLIRPWLVALALALVALIAVRLLVRPETVYTANIPLAPLRAADSTQVVFSPPIALRGDRTVRVTLRAPVDNTWFAAEGDLVNEATGLVQGFSLPVEYYHGSDSDGAWSEGSPSGGTTLSALPTGTYTLRLEATWERWQAPITVAVRVEQGISPMIHWWLLLGLITLPMLLSLIRYGAFETRRWSESMYGPATSASDDDDD